MKLLSLVRREFSPEEEEGRETGMAGIDKIGREQQCCGCCQELSDEEKIQNSEMHKMLDQTMREQAGLCGMRFALVMQNSLQMFGLLHSGKVRCRDPVPGAWIIHDLLCLSHDEPYGIKGAEIKVRLKRTAGEGGGLNHLGNIVVDENTVREVTIVSSNFFCLWCACDQGNDIPPEPDLCGRGEENGQRSQAADRDVPRKAIRLLCGNCGRPMSQKSQCVKMPIFRLEENTSLARRSFTTGPDG